MRKHTWRLGRPPTQKPMSAAERMRHLRARRKAAGLRPAVTWVARGPRPRPRPPPLELRLLQARSLALHVMVARKIEGDPRQLAVAHRSLARWREHGSATPGAATRAWRKALRLPWPEIAALMTEQSESGVRLRGTTPFLEALTRREGRRVYGAFRVVKGRPSFQADHPGITPAAES